MQFVYDHIVNKLTRGKNLRPEVNKPERAVCGCLWLRTNKRKERVASRQLMAGPALGTGWAPNWVQQGDASAPGPLLHHIRAYAIRTASKIGDLPILMGLFSAAFKLILMCATAPAGLRTCDSLELRHYYGALPCYYSAGQAKSTILVDLFRRLPEPPEKLPFASLNMILISVSLKKIPTRQDRHGKFGVDARSITAFGATYPNHHRFSSGYRAAVQQFGHHAIVRGCYGNPHEVADLRAMPEGRQPRSSV
ncbi:hypothetical protein OH77DRAFT_1440223 [Trametes cingulata]|nr:hypothetical protein OH77DRAFT_1440223 [Trametes cingulata]